MSILPIAMQTAFTTITFFRFSGRNRWWIFTQMPLAGKHLSGVAGLSFGKLMGSGHGAGFSARPNLSVYSFLGVWDDAAAFHRFFTVGYGQTLQQHAIETTTVLQWPVKAKGRWDKQQPFVPVAPHQLPAIRGIITRATIRPTQLLRFWRQVPATSRATEAANGRLFSIGIGEWPWIQQATYSLWTSEVAMRQFAYKSKAHQDAIKMTQQFDWYKEELFARFVPFATIGTWHGDALLNHSVIPNFSDVPPPSVLQDAASAAGQTMA